MAAELLDFTGSPHGGVYKLLPEWQSQPQIHPVGLVKHTIVGSAAGAFYYFRDTTGTESTFILPKTGVIWQIMSITRQSDAQVAGNYWKVGGVGYGFLSVETEDNGDPEHDPWTVEQVESIMWLDDKLARVFGWPRQQTPAPYGDPAAGSGYHSMWLRTQYMTPDGLQPWTLAAWKGCPAMPRIGQYRNELLPAYLNQAPPEDTLSAAEVDAINKHTDEVAAIYYRMLARAEVAGKVDPTRLRTSLVGLDGQLRLILGGQSDQAGVLAALADDEGKVIAAVKAAELADVARDAALAEAVAAVKAGGGTVDVDALAERMYAAADRALAERLGKAAS